MYSLFDCWILDKKSICFSEFKYLVSESFFPLLLQQHQAFAHEFIIRKNALNRGYRYREHNINYCAVHCTMLCAMLYCVVMRCDLSQFSVITFAIIAYSTVDTPSCSAQFSKCLITSRDSITNLNEWFVIFFINRVRAQSSISIATQANLFHVVLNKLEHC